MTEPTLTPVILCELDLDEPQQVAFADGHAVIFSRRSPLRETVNQDSAAILPISAQTGLLVVADGVGGMQSGHAASATAIESLCEELDKGVSDDQMRSAILDGIEAANSRICALGANSATTLAAIEVQADRIRPYHVGDSMILLCGQRGKLIWQSISHSPVGYAVEAGVIDEEDAMSHPDRHYVSNVVGCTGMRIEIGPPLSMNERDTLLLCSDGLSDNLSTDEIIAIIRKGDLTTAVANLVKLATERMLVPALATEPETPSKPDDLSIIAFRRTLPR